MGILLTSHTMTNQETLTEQEAQQFLDSFQDDPTDISLTEDTSSELYTIKQNERIINLADKNLIERLEHQDWSLRITDIVSAKDSAFKSNLKLLGLDDDKNTQLIPANITINIVNNNG